MPIGTMATHVFRVIRRTSELMPARAVAASMVPDVTDRPMTPAYVQLIAADGPGLTGIVTIVGEVDGAPATEDVEFSGSMGSTVQLAQKNGCKLFDVVTELQVAGLSGVTLAAKFVDAGGHAVSINQELASEVRGALEPIGGGGKWPMGAAGAVVDSSHYLMHDDWYGFIPRRGDAYIETRRDGSTTKYEVKGIEPTRLGALRPHHFEMRVRELQTEDTDIVGP